MNFGEIARNSRVFLAAAGLAFGLTFVATAQASAPLPEAPVAASPVAEPVAAPAEAGAATVEAAPAAPVFEHYGPDMIKGQPTSADEDLLASMTFQDQYTENGNYALWMHDAILMPVITVISLFVLGLLMWVVVRYNKRRNPVASKNSHNTLIEVIWTVVPVLILVAISVPSITLISRQYASPPEDAITIKATGYQWYWGYSYPDYGGFEVISNMMPEADAIAAGFPSQLEVDNRMVVPVGVPIRIQTIGSDVIHAFGIPSLWFKIDAVPGRINEKMMTITEPGIYYGQCMELCGARHGYMPIAIEARPMAEFEQWILSRGGTLPGADAAGDAAAAGDPAPAEPAASDAAGDVSAEQPTT